MDASQNLTEPSSCLYKHTPLSAEAGAEVLHTRMVLVLVPVLRVVITHTLGARCIQILFVSYYWLPSVQMSNSEAELLQNPLNITTTHE